LASTPVGHRPIVFVDDDPAVRSSWRRPLSLLRVTEMAASVADGVAVLERTEPLIVLSDVHMPDRLGFELIVYAREQYPHASRRLFTGEPDPTTGLVRAEWNDRAVELTRHPLLPKNFGIATMQRLVFEAISKEAGGEDRVAAFVADLAQLAGLARSPKQVQLLAAVAAGRFTHDVLCVELGHIDRSTLVTHERRLREKLDGGFSTLGDLHRKLILGAFGLQGGLDPERLRTGRAAVHQGGDVPWLRR
jgi:DNA-binding NarL/FixJ family response regulator